MKLLPIVTLIATFTLLFHLFFLLSQNVEKEELALDQEMNILKTVNEELVRLKHKNEVWNKHWGSKEEIKDKIPINVEEPQKHGLHSSNIIANLQEKVVTKAKGAVIFTMDSIGSYEERSRSGGAAGTNKCY